jgi:hypothetical protein
VRAAANGARSIIAIREAIRRVWENSSRRGSPVFLQNHSFEEAIAMPGAQRDKEVERFNLARFAALDLAFGHRDPRLREYVLGEGLSAAQYEWFMQAGNTQDTILGIDHYPGCVHTYAAEQIIHHDPTMPSHFVPLVRTYADRYGLQDRLLHMETNGPPAVADLICRRTYDEIGVLRGLGYAIHGMGWYGDEVQIGWQTLLYGADRFREYPVGLFYRGERQPVANMFSRLARRGLPPIGGPARPRPAFLPGLRMAGLRWPARS